VRVQRLSQSRRVIRRLRRRDEVNFQRIFMHKLLTSLFTLLGFVSAQASDFPANVDLNRKTIETLIDAGSDPKKDHPLEHHFYCFDYDSLNALLAKGESLGYRKANVGEGDDGGEKYWYGDLIKERSLDLKAINEENSLMLKLAHEFKSDYDGWGTPVVE